MIDSIQTLLSYDEGCESLPYPDSRGIWTVGVGHNLEANPLPQSLVDAIVARAGLSSGDTHFPGNRDLITAAGGLTNVEIAELFAHDVTAVENGLPSWIADLDLGDSPQPVVYAVMIDIAFNVGVYEFSKFNTFLPLVKSGNYAGAANDLLTHVAASRELPERYGRLAEMLRTLEWPTV